LAINLDALVVNIIVNTIIIAPVIWLAGKALVGAKAKFTDAIWIVILGTVVGTFLGFVFERGFIASIVQLILWLAIVKHFFDCGWLKALVVSILAVIIFAAVVIILGLMKFALFTLI